MVSNMMRVAKNVGETLRDLKKCKLMCKVHGAFPTRIGARFRDNKCHSSFDKHIKRGTKSGFAALKRMGSFKEKKVFREDPECQVEFVLRVLWKREKVSTISVTRGIWIRPSIFHIPSTETYVLGLLIARITCLYDNGKSQTHECLSKE